MACSAHDIPSLEFPRDEIIEVIPSSYNNSSKRIHIENLPDVIIPSSPQDIKIHFPPSGTVSPLSGVATPVDVGTTTPESGEKENGNLPPRMGSLTSRP